MKSVFKKLKSLKLPLKQLEKVKGGSNDSVIIADVIGY